MKAWEWEYKIRRQAAPESNFTGIYGEDFAPNMFNDDFLLLIWYSEVPGSGAPDSLILGAIQAVENMGRDVSKALELYKEGFEAYKDRRIGKLRAITAEIFSELESAPKVENHPYHRYKRPLKWEEISKDFPKGRSEVEGDIFENIYNGWIGQIAGAAMGTRLEGYFSEALEQAYGDRLGYYLEIPPSTVNDDITYEIAVLETVREYKKLTSHGLALKWLELIKFGWSAEFVALRNLERGIMPPESGRLYNPFQEWIGAQMRTMVHGFLHPGDPYSAAKSAYIDSVISHSGNGVYAGIHSAVLTSLAFSIKNPKELILEAEKFVPKGTEFESVVKETRKVCERSAEWREVHEWAKGRFKTYNWIHAYPNAAAVITALWFGSSFDEVMEIIARFGYDVDCNAGEAGSVAGIIYDVPDRWKDPLNDTLETYVPGYERVSIKRLAGRTYELIS